jgi:Extensin-like protein C-terminus
MSRKVQRALPAAVVAALIALAGCSHYLSGEREAWRHDAEVACLGSGGVKDGPERVQITAISGPGICGIDFPLRVSALGVSGPLGYDDEALRPPGAIPQGSLPSHWPVAQPNNPPPISSNGAPYGAAPSGRVQTGAAQDLRWQTGPPPATQSRAPMSIYAPGVPVPEPDAEEFEPAPPRVYGGASDTRSGMPSTALPPPSVATPDYPPPNYPPPNYSRRAEPTPAPPYEGAPLGPSGTSRLLATGGPVEVKPAATLACPIVSALDRWIAASVQPAAMRWFREPVIEIKQISAYSCRGMNGNPNAHVSEHAFGNALDIAEFTLADGHRISVQYGWRGAPEEQGFLHDVQLAACEQFSTVLAPGANVYHYNHIHVDLMRHASLRHICEPSAIPGEVVAERARGHYYASHHEGEPAYTGAIKSGSPARPLGYARENDRLPLAEPGAD